MHLPEITRQLATLLVEVERHVAEGQIHIWNRGAGYPYMTHLVIAELELRDALEHLGLVARNLDEWRLLVRAHERRSR